MRFKGVTLFGIILMVLSIAMQIGLFAFTYSGTKDDSPVLVMYLDDDGKIPQSIFRMAMGRAGFNVVTVHKDLSTANEVGEEMSLPKGYRSQQTVILAQGKNATSALKLFDADEDTIGFVLVNPEFETNYSMEGMSTEFPSHNVAIFTDDQSEKSDAKIIYERLSGEDTLYGITSRPGGILSSSVYINPKGNRYLSVAKFTKGDGDLFYSSPTFQTELANYLYSNYGETTKAPASSIVTWYILFIMSAFSFVTGLFLFLSKIPVIRYRMVSDNKDKLDSVTKIIIMALSILTAVGLSVMIIFEKFTENIGYIVGLFPCAMLVVMALFRLLYLMKNLKIKKPNKNVKLAVILCASLVLYMLFIVLNTFGISKVSSDIMFLVAILAAILQVLSVLIVARCDNISRIKGFGGCSYYGEYLMVIFTAMPSVALFLVGALLNKDMASYYGITGFCCASLPFLASLPVKRHSNSVTFTSITHGLIYIIVLILSI